MARDVNKLFENHMGALYQKVYDRAFCQALDKGMSLPDCAEYADMKVLKCTEELMYFEADEEIILDSNQH